jgi:protocatechuate 3,4-dioxygenase beta subunit
VTAEEDIVSKTTQIDDDDRPVGKVLSRREVLGLLGALGGGALLVACGSSNKSQATASTSSGGSVQRGSNVAASTNGSCVGRPELTEGPYFVDEKLNRSDIRSDTSTNKVSDGTPLALAFNVTQANNSCAPLASAQVDVWHCDAVGVYSDATDPGFNTRGQNFLRGYQMTDADGAARFTTIVPGWYAGRAVHIHFKIRTRGADGNAYEFTSQLFFDPNTLTTVYAVTPYSTHKGDFLRNEKDDIYNQSKGQTMVDLAKDGSGYSTTFDIALDLTDAKTGAADGMSTGGRGSPGGGPGGPPPQRPQ